MNGPDGQTVPPFDAVCDSGPAGKERPRAADALTVARLDWERLPPATRRVFIAVALAVHRAERIGHLMDLPDPFHCRLWNLPVSLHRARPQFFGAVGGKPFLDRSGGLRRVPGSSTRHLRAFPAIRRRERKQQKFKSPGPAQGFLCTHAAVYNTFEVQIPLIGRPILRRFRAQDHQTWTVATAAA